MSADYVTDIEYERGDSDGEVIAFGTPEEVMKSKKCYKARFMREYKNAVRF